ncbi:MULTISPECIES: hypothetical protein [Actinoalloteichus]|uniref:Syndecan 1 n=1 Tax=Actinoalloteichus fjordicus TaxID=1612552 RepID=A0AAC9LG01_9PSEU|nr:MULTISPECIES: hypothetical protein [Actinoalloteichus]APU16179.1 hypothetical protein UA74_20770 [Actinoalloteichus fjordicus]APU22241.1 hypothetical protein UA75_21260 [Actinoalloteichus sp. GBA129-24]
MAWWSRLLRSRARADGAGRRSSGTAETGAASNRTWEPARGLAADVGSVADSGADSGDLASAGPAGVESGSAAAWDGGWRALAPLSGVIQRSPAGVSDGIRFRTGLAAWQNPRLGGELGHLVSPAAPAGLIGGLLRPVDRAEGGAERTAGGPPLVRLATVPRDATEAARSAPLLSRAPTSGESGPSAGAVVRRPAGPAVSDAAVSDPGVSGPAVSVGSPSDAASVARYDSAVAAEPVRARPVGPSLIVARAIRPLRSLPAVDVPVRSASTAAAARGSAEPPAVGRPDRAAAPTLGRDGGPRTAADANAGSAPVPPTDSGGAGGRPDDSDPLPSTPVVRARSASPADGTRRGLGAPLSNPPTAVQRAERTSGRLGPSGTAADAVRGRFAAPSSPARSRVGLGSPLTALPPSALPVTSSPTSAGRPAATADQRGPRPSGVEHAAELPQPGRTGPTSSSAGPSEQAAPLGSGADRRPTRQETSGTAAHEAETQDSPRSPAPRIESAADGPTAALLGREPDPRPSGEDRSAASPPDRDGPGPIVQRAGAEAGGSASDGARHGRGPARGAPTGSEGSGLAPVPADGGSSKGPTPEQTAGTDASARLAGSDPRRSDGRRDVSDRLPLDPSTVDSGSSGASGALQTDRSLLGADVGAAGAGQPIAEPLGRESGTEPASLPVVQPVQRSEIATGSAVRTAAGLPLHTAAGPSTSHPAADRAAGGQAGEPRPTAVSEESGGRRRPGGPSAGQATLPPAPPDHGAAPPSAASGEAARLGRPAVSRTRRVGLLGDRPLRPAVPSAVQRAVAGPTGDGRGDETATRPPAPVVPLRWTRSAQSAVPADPVADATADPAPARPSGRSSSSAERRRAARRGRAGARDLRPGAEGAGATTASGADSIAARGADAFAASGADSNAASGAGSSTAGGAGFSAERGAKPPAVKGTKPPDASGAAGSARAGTPPLTRQAPISQAPISRVSPVSPGRPGSILQRRSEAWARPSAQAAATVSAARAGAAPQALRTAPVETRAVDGTTVSRPAVVLPAPPADQSGPAAPVARARAVPAGLPPPQPVPIPGVPITVSRSPQLARHVGPDVGPDVADDRRPAAPPGLAGTGAASGTGVASGLGMASGPGGGSAARSGAELDDLARRLLDPVSRLLRAELRHGRERIGRLHDRRR